MSAVLQSARAVLFDFDGTLADTAPDMARALNRLLQQHGREPAPIERLRPMVSRGARGMVTEGFGIEDTDATYPRLRDAFLDLYHAELVVETALFAGIDWLLTALEDRGIRWGIVTNKHSRYALPIVKSLGLAERAAVTVCGDTTAHTKPHPEPLLAAARAVGVAPQDCIYVGDDVRDALAAEAAGMHFVAALYGYLGKGADPTSWPQTAAAQSPERLGELLGFAPRSPAAAYNFDRCCNA